MAVTDRFASVNELENFSLRTEYLIPKANRRKTNMQHEFSDINI
jgi:hypothetical protein